MAQTTGHITSKHSTVEVAENCLDYTDISGSSNKFDPTGGEHEVGTTYTFEGYQALLALARLGPFTGTLTAVYTEVDTEATDLLLGFWENQTRICIRHRPKGAGAGNWEFIYSVLILGPAIPMTDATSSDIIIKDVPWIGTLLSWGPQAT